MKQPLRRLINRWRGRGRPRSLLRNRWRHLRRPGRSGGYGGGYDGSDSLFPIPGLAYTPQPPASITRENLLRTRSVARFLAERSPMGRSAVRLRRLGILGAEGIMPVPKPRLADGSIDTAAQKVLREGFQQWSRRAYSNERQGWQNLQRAILWHYLVDGELFLHKVSRGNRLAVELVDPGRVPVWLTIDRQATNKPSTEMGIDRNADGQPVGYFVLERVKSTTLSAAYDIGVQRGRMIPASRILHVVEPRWIEQGRGLTPFIPAINLLEGNRQLLDGILYRADVESRLMAAKTGQADDAMREPPELTEGDGNSDAPGDGDAQASDLGDGRQAVWLNFTDGTVTHFPMHSINSTGFKDFDIRMCHHISAALGVPYSMLLTDMSGINYSSTRAEMEAFNRGCGEARNILQDVAFTPIYLSWLSRSLIAGTLPGLRAADFDRLSEHGWTQPPPAVIDPTKTAAYYEKMVRLGVLSPIDVINEMGGDPDDVAQGFATAAEIGLPAPAAPVDNPAEVEDNDETDDEEGDEDAPKDNAQP